jgi:hypothetical protein
VGTALGILYTKGFARLLRLLACTVTVCLSCLSSVPVHADPVAANIGTGIAGVEWQLERAERCQSSADTLQRRLDRLAADPVTHAAAIAETQARLLANKACVQSAVARASSLELSLASLREQLLSASRADAAALAAHVDGLRAAERERASIDFDIRLMQFQIDKLSRAISVNQTLLNQKIAIRENLRASLTAAVARVAAANSALAGFETSALAVLAERRATLNWSTPTTREDGAPLAAGEIGGFEIYMLAESTGETNVITVNDPMSTTFTVEDLAPDTYHFSMSAFDVEGTFSPLSEIVVKTVR